MNIPRKPRTTRRKQQRRHTWQTIVRTDMYGLSRYARWNVAGERANLIAGHMRQETTCEQ